ncbi:MAG: T9SS type A sorting domain-containing protein [Candidatus Eisenbacteria bacterium]|nr:T9SS type A sorting domain-containing protein [Candidatus Eisenbacteria bacterium]
MKRIVISALLLTAALAAAYLLYAPLQEDASLTADEISEKIIREKKARRAERAAAGLPFGPGEEPNDWSFRQRAYPYDRLNYEELTQALGEAETMREAARKKGPRATWVERGPSNIGARLADLAFDSSDPNTIYAAMASGGVFRSSDGGASWVPIFDDQPVLTIGAIAVDPLNPDVLYVGTGESAASSFSWFGIGMFKSEDRGNTWRAIGLEESRAIARIVVDPIDTDRIWIAACGVLFGTGGERGIYRSLDGGESWTRVLFVNDSTAAIDVAIDPTKPDTVYAAMWERVRGLTYRRSGGPGSGIWRSHDGGDTWTLLTSGLPSAGPSVGRIGLSVSASSPNVVYAIYDIVGEGARVYKTTNGGNSWTRTNDSAVSHIHSSFGWYFGQIRVDPSDPNRVFAHGVPLYRSENGGSSWSEVGEEVHVDHHAMAFDPSNPDRIFEGNDGGIYVSTDEGDTWTKLYNQPTNQFYAITIDYLHPERLYGGTQDNGTLRTPTGAIDDWESILGGDGFYTIVDPRNSNILFAEYQYGNLYKSTNFGASWSWALSGVNSGDRRNWSTPVVLDPSNPDRMFYGTYRLYRSTNAASSWSAVSGDLTNGNQGGNYGTITTIAVSPVSGSVIWVGTDDANLWVTTNGGGNWTKVSGSLPNRWVSRVAADPIDPAVAYATFSGLRWNEEIAHVYRTDDYGATWTDCSGNLPGAPVNALLVDPDDPNTLYLGSDVGCFTTSDLGGAWYALGENLPSVPVYDLAFHRPTRTLVAGTHGRSMHSLAIPTPTGVARAESAPPAAKLSLSTRPNPFNPRGEIVYVLEESAPITLGVYDLAGRLVKRLAEGTMAAGEHRSVWDGSDEPGRPASSGTYFLRLESGDYAATRKISLVR